MTTVSIRPVFVSHGAPDLLLADVPARTFLESLADSGPKPRAIVVASAHWTTREPMVDASRTPRTIHDFSGFAAELMRVEYAAKGDPELASDVVRELAAHGIAATTRERGLDHGAWVPLALAWPDADVPVLQVSVQPHLGPAHHLKLGRALERFCSEGVLVIGSGSATHDLHALQPPGSAVPDWVRAFDDWLVDAVERGDVEALVDYRSRAPFGAENHPTEEHYVPLLVALGAAGPNARGWTLHRSTTYGVLSMTAFSFGGLATQPVRGSGR